MEEKDVKKEKKTTTASKKEPKKETKKVETKKEEPKKDTKTVTETNKKFEKTKDSKKESNSALIIAIVIIALIIIASIAYMLFKIDSPKQAVEKLFNETKAGSQMQEMFAGLMQENEESELPKLIFENLSWKILKEEENGDTATVEVEVTNKDFNKVMVNLQQKLMKAALNGESIDESKTQEYLLEELANDEIENVTNTHSITVVKQDGKWVVSEENNVVNILLPGLNEAIDALD